MTTPAGTIDYAYDHQNRLTSVTDPQDQITRLSYNPVGLLTQIAYPNGIREAYTYNALNQVQQITQTTAQQQVIGRYTYVNDRAGNRQQVTELDGTTIQWTYDAAYRLKNETRTERNAVSRTGYTYDAAGNRLTETINGQRTNYSYNDLDQLTQTAGSNGTTNYQYDERGNLISTSAGTDYSYDTQDRLTSVELPDGTTLSYGYDADGRRVAQTSGLNTTHYLWDETSPYGDVVWESSGSSNASYILADERTISQTRAGLTSYYLHDAQGSTRALTNSTGQITNTYDYTAFGETSAQTGTIVNPYLYTGQWYDSLTRQYNLRARYYVPDLGRFLTQDTWAYNFQNPIELNRYVYGANNPIRYSDPTGLMADYSQLNGHSATATNTAGHYTLRRMLFDFVIGAFAGAAGYLLGTFVYGCLEAAAMEDQDVKDMGAVWSNMQDSAGSSALFWANCVIYGAFGGLSNVMISKKTYTSHEALNDLRKSYKDAGYDLMNMSNESIDPWFFINREFYSLMEGALSQQTFLEAEITWQTIRYTFFTNFGGSAFATMLSNTVDTGTEQEKAEIWDDVMLVFVGLVQQSIGALIIPGAAQQINHKLGDLEWGANAWGIFLSFAVTAFITAELSMLDTVNPTQSK